MFVRFIARCDKVMYAAVTRGKKELGGINKEVGTLPVP